MLSFAIFYKYKIVQKGLMSTNGKVIRNYGRAIWK